MTEEKPEITVHPTGPGLTATQWVVVGASVQGTRHIQIPLPCQDAYACEAIDDSIFIAAVADGLGTAVHAQAGSRLAAGRAVACAREWLAQALPGDEAGWLVLARSCFLAARLRLETEARANQTTLRDYSTTLVLAILAGDWLVIGHIGDGAVVACLEDGELVLVSEPKNDEYVNVTYPLTMPDMMDVAEFKACETKVKALALMTDGMQSVSIRTADKSPHAPFFEPLFRQLPGVKDMPKASQNLAEFMASAAISKHTDDDKTLVLIGRQRI